MLFNPTETQLLRKNAFRTLEFLTTGEFVLMSTQ